MNKYIFASFNKNKLLEIDSKIRNIELISLTDMGYSDKIEETGLTLEDNALIKSRTIYKKYSIPCLSDDTGLEVYSLNGRPGVFSARYASEVPNARKNMKKLLKEMENIQDRRARFRTVICLKNHLEEKLFEGVVEGVIGNNIIGNKGFGYDPIFIPNGYRRTFAEISLESKNKISHRGFAIKKLAAYLNK